MKAVYLVEMGFKGENGEVIAIVATGIEAIAIKSDVKRTSLFNQKHEYVTIRKWRLGQVSIHFEYAFTERDLGELDGKKN